MELMTVAEAATFLRLAPATLYKLRCQGRIPSLRAAGRAVFDKDELIEWLKESRPNKAPARTPTAGEPRGA